mmetsp:Transcript_15815/g.34627  ORF Transcript_15815/g.34627 Transcript_15815/m.34627 type:complete len:945 (-) Transcript_15815:91-2925(-)
MAELLTGTLVELHGLPTEAAPAPEAAAAGATPIQLNGQRAQLVRYDRECDKWIAATFSGTMVAVDPKHVRELSASDLTNYDFVFGPRSDVDTVGAELADVLARKGFAVMKLFVSPEDADDMLSVAHQLDKERQFSRLAIEFERGYLGKDSTAKTLLVDPASAECPDFVKDSALRTMDRNFGAITQMLSPYFEDALGFDVYSRTSLLLRMPLTEEDEDEYPPADIDDGDAEGYMHTMVRKKMTLLQFVGPSKGRLTLSPAFGQPGEDIEIEAEPHTLVLVVAGRYEYTYETVGNSLALTSFLLSEPASFTLENIVGDANRLTLESSGPSPPKGEQLSVTGMYCRYGTNGDGRAALWSGVGKGATDGLTEVPAARWDYSMYYDPDGLRGGAYTKHGCFGIEGVDLFDCRFFEISPGEAKGMDPVQRQVMEVSYMALLEGGYDKKSLQRKPENIGHLVGIDKDDWLCMSSIGMIDLTGATGAAAAANSITSNRFSFSLNLKGTSMTIDTACSSSLVATHVGKLHLRYKDNERMPACIINGVNLMLYAGPFISCCAAGMLSHKGRCFTFDKSADGYARGELCGAMCVAAKQFDPDDGTLCCLAGTFSNQDGRSASLTAPNGPAQEKCIKSVLQEVGLTPTEVDCFECHGTGTALGDPIEVGSFRKVMSATPREVPILITTSKSNMAHGEGGAGLAGFMKCCLQVMHCEAASNVHLYSRNPHLDLEGFPAQVLSEVVVMREESAYTGVSSFGFGGTNAHAEAWGRNIMTSRGTLCQDPNVAFQKKLMGAPPAEITMNGDNVMEWETTGLDPRAEPDSRWTIEIDEDGIVNWELADDDIPDFGDEFFIRGSFSEWEPVPLERHDSVEGCWFTTVTLGDKGEEEFQIMGDGEADKILCPSTARCTLKSAPINGPKEAGRENAWLISGSEGDTFRVEFFQQDKHISVMWWRE